jgi:MFS family permease
VTWNNRLKQAKSVAIVASGNFLEMYDFMVFGYYAVPISRMYFPAGSELASLMLTLMTFGAGFLMRPVGALILGAYIDRHGRRKGLILTLALMALGTLIIAVTPGYSTIGLAAPLLIVAGRLVQGLSAGVEIGGVSVYLSEIAPPGRKGFYVAWQSASQQMAVMFAAATGLITNSLLSEAQMREWGWRVPFLIGCLLVPFLLLLRRRLEETAAFKAQVRRPDFNTVCKTLVANWSVVIRGAMMAITTTVFFYMITAYTPTYAGTVLHLGARESFSVTLCVGLLNFIMLPAVGAVSDNIGRLPLLIGASLLGLLTGYPLMHWLVADASFERLLIVLMFFAAVYATYNGAMVVYLTEIMPAHVRTSGFSVAYSLATGLFGGFTPAIATYLIDATGDRAIPGAWLMVAALIGLASALSFAIRRHASALLPSDLQ